MLQEKGQKRRAIVFRLPVTAVHSSPDCGSADAPARLPGLCEDLPQAR